MKPENLAGRYYYHHHNEVWGPVEFEELNNHVFSGILAPTVSCCREGSDAWVPFHDLHKNPPGRKKMPEATRSGQPFGLAGHYLQGRTAVVHAGTIFLIAGYLLLVAAAGNFLASLAAERSGGTFFAMALACLISGLLTLFLTRASVALAQALFDIADEMRKR